MDVDGSVIRARLEREAKALGFHGFGVCHVPVDVHADYFRAWLEDAQYGSMGWLARDPERRLDARQVLPEVCSIIVLSLNYYQPDPECAYRIAKYALGDDYHNFMLKRLKKLCRILRDEYGGVQRPYVDTGPLLEKPVAAAAGLGWQGKSTILIEPKRGTWSFLANILTTLELPADEAVKDRCGSCTRCLDVCPTQAITGPYQLDARRCISYLTIEHDGPIPLEYRVAIGDRLYGCDECLDVCPWNKWAVRTEEPRFTRRELPSLRDMLRWDEVTFAERMQGSPLRRLKLRRLRRNICVVLGNVGTVEDVPALQWLAGLGDELLAEHALWALERIDAREG